MTSRLQLRRGCGGFCFQGRNLGVNLGGCLRVFHASQGAKTKPDLGDMTTSPVMIHFKGGRKWKEFSLHILWPLRYLHRVSLVQFLIFVNKIQETSFQCHDLWPLTLNIWKVFASRSIWWFHSFQIYPWRLRSRSSQRSSRSWSLGISAHCPALFFLTHV